MMETRANPPTERRKENRQRVFKGGKVYYNEYAMCIDCTIRNESEHGVYVSVDPTITLPESVSLLNRKEGTLAEAQIIWKNAGAMGLSFTSEVRDVRSFNRADIRRMSIIASGG